jgi:septum formation protein
MIEALSGIQCRQSRNSVSTTSASKSNDQPGVRLILASGSPRRRELLGYLGVPFEIIVTDAEEQEHPAPTAINRALPNVPVPPANHPTLLAWRKAQAVADTEADAVVIGADTIVVLEDQVLNKPRDRADAQSMLRMLAGRTHTVYTGLCVVHRADTESQTGTTDPTPIDGSSLHLSRLDDGSRRIELAVVASCVEMNAHDADAIAAYVATGEPMDKAGAYGIQGMGGRLVRAVHGSYTAVVGLPLGAIHALLSAAGVQRLQHPTDAYRRWLQVQGKEPLPWPPTLP